MLHALAIWLLVAAFFGAGLFNAIGTAGTRADFVRWDFPAWWCRVTGGLEMVTAVVIAVPRSRDAGLVIGAVTIAVAAVAVLRHREFSHLVPLGVFAGLLALVGFWA